MIRNFLILLIGVMLLNSQLLMAQEEAEQQTSQEQESQHNDNMQRFLRSELNYYSGVSAGGISDFEGRNGGYLSVPSQRNSLRIDVPFDLELMVIHQQDGDVHILRNRNSMIARIVSLKPITVFGSADETVQIELEMGSQARGDGFVRVNFDTGEVQEIRDNLQGIFDEMQSLESEIESLDINDPADRPRIQELQNRFYALRDEADLVQDDLEKLQDAFDDREIRIRGSLEAFFGARVTVNPGFGQFVVATAVNVGGGVSYSEGEDVGGVFVLRGTAMTGYAILGNGIALKGALHYTLSAGQTSNTGNSVSGEAFLEINLRNLTRYSPVDIIPISVRAGVRRTFYSDDPINPDLGTMFFGEVQFVTN